MAGNIWFSHVLCYNVSHMNAINESILGFLRKPNVTTSIRYVALACLFAAPFSLLYVDTSLLFPYITGKNFLWRQLITVAALLWLALAFSNARYRPNLRNSVWLGVLGVLTAYGLAAIFGMDPFRSFWSNAERMDGWIGLAHLGLYVTVLIGLLDSRVLWHRFLHALLIAGTLVSCTGLAQGDNVIRIFGTLGNPIYLGSVALLSIFICTYFASFKDRLLGTDHTRLAIYGVWALFFLYILFETGTRGALLGLGIGAFVTAIMILITVNRSESRFFWWGSIATVVLFLMVTTAFVFRAQIKDVPAVQALPVISRIAEVSLDDDTTIHRLANWQMGLEGFQERPIFGWGQENYIHVFSQNYKPEILYDAEQWFDRTHNTLLDWLVFGGLVGFLSFFVLFALYVKTLWRPDTVGQNDTGWTALQRSILTGLLAAYIAQNLVAFDSLASGVFMFGIVGFVAWSYRGATTDIKSFDMQKLVFLLPMIVLVGIWWLYQSTVLPKKDVRTFITSITIPAQFNNAKSQISNSELSNEQKTQALEQVTTQYAEGLSAQLPEIETVLKREGIFSQEILEQMLTRSQDVLGPDVPANVRDAYFSLLSQEAEYLLERKPFLTRINLFYGQMLANAGITTARGEQKGADYYFEQALASSPDKLQILLLLGQNEIRKGDASKALEYGRRAVALAPEYEVARQFVTQLETALSQASVSATASSS